MLEDQNARTTANGSSLMPDGESNVDLGFVQGQVIPGIPNDFFKMDISNDDDDEERMVLLSTNTVPTIVNNVVPDAVASTSNQTITTVQCAQNSTHPKPFKCHLCAYSSRLNFSLTRHMRTHTRGKPYACNRCSERFAYSNQLKKHVKTHEAASECDEAGEGGCGKRRCHICK